MNLENFKSFVVAGIIAITAPFLFTDCSNKNSQQFASNPNIIIFFIDDMGYGDIEPFGSKMNKTPNLNILADEGLRFTQFYLASVACSPSRSALLTGCYAERVSMNGRVCFPNEDKALNPDEFTLPEMLKEAGYVTGCFGKWHLGHRPGYLPQDHGFDVFHGIPYSNDMWSTYDAGKKQWDTLPNAYPPLPWIVGKEAVAIVKDGVDQSYLTQATTSAALEFIREYGDQYKEGGSPFLCYIPYAAVHLARYGHRDFMPAGYDRDYSELKGKDYSLLEGYPDENRMHLKAQIEELDWATGQILKSLEESGIEKNTLILFLSDNGGARYTDMGPFRGSKGQSAYEGGRRTAFIAWWPGTIPEGKTTNEIGITCDLMPTLARFCGGSLQDVKIDGMDLSGLFLDPEYATSPHKTVPYGGKAFREGKWKVVGKDQLYDLERDPGESINLAGKYPEKLEELVKKNEEWMRSIRSEARPCAKMQDPSPLVLLSEADLMPKLSEYLNN